MSSARALTGVSQISSLVSDAAQPPPQLEVPQELPIASESALNFIKSIADNDFQYLQFEDTLATYSDTGRDLGEYKVSVVAGRKDGQDCFFIEASSQGSIDGVPCGTSITASVTTSLETLEQNHHEYVKLENHPLDRRTKFIRQENGYMVTKEVVQGEKKETLSKLFEFGALEGFISEAANLLLQRLLVTKGLPSYFEVLAFDADSNICMCSYTYLGERPQPINGQDVIVSGLQRTIQSITDLPTTWQTYFMPDGHLISRTQVGSPIVMKVKVVPELIEPDEHLPKPKFEKKELEWEDDKEMYSKFLDRKEQLMADHRLYLHDHPDVEAILADFLQYLLLRKPDDVIPFAAEYFASFSARLPMANSYMHSAESTLFPLPK